MKKYLLFESNEDAVKSVGEGEKRTVKAGGKVICLIRSKGRLRSFDNACPHRSHPLNEGSINHLHEIVCSSHAYRFNTTTGEEAEPRCAGLTFYPIVEEDGKLYIEC